MLTTLTCSLATARRQGGVWAVPMRASDLDEPELAPPSRSASWSSWSPHYRGHDMRPRTTRCCWRVCERPRRSWWRSSRRAAREPPVMVRAWQKHALRAHVMPGGVAAVMCGPLGCLAALFGLMRTLRLLGMIGTRRCAFSCRASAVRVPCPGSVWTWQPL